MHCKNSSCKKASCFDFKVWRSVKAMHIELVLATLEATPTNGGSARKLSHLLSIQWHCLPFSISLVHCMHGNKGSSYWHEEDCFTHDRFVDIWLNSIVTFFAQRKLICSL